MENHFLEAKKYIPGGVNSPVRAFQSVGRDPLFISKANGSKIYDSEGKEYIDYVCSWGPGILGHAQPDVIKAVQKVAENGLTFGAPTVIETELAKLICNSVEACQRVRLVSSGTEAVMSAIRVARGFTKRDKIVKFSGNYHGHSDALLVAAGSGLLTQSVPSSAGVPEAFTSNTILAPYNDIEKVSEIFEKNPNEIACVIVEPVAANMGVVPPKEGFLQGLRDLCDKYGALLIFDEVITGFRIAFGGASEKYGVVPDMVTMGKIVGGGMPLAAYGGKKEIMDMVAPVGDVYQAGTLSGNPVAVTAGLETLKILKNNPQIYTYIDKQAEKIEKSFLSAGLIVNRVGSLVSAFFTNKPVENYEDAKSCDTAEFARYFGHMLDKNIYVAPSQFEAMFVSNAHSDDDISLTCKAIEEYINDRKVK